MTLISEIVSYMVSYIENLLERQTPEKIAGEKILIAFSVPSVIIFQVWIRRRVYEIQIIKEKQRYKTLVTLK